MATTRYISPTGNDTTGDGTQGNPYLTMTKADSVSSNGDTVIALSGTYTLPAGGWKMLTAGVTFKSDAKYGAKIVPPGSPTVNTPFWFSAANTVIDGFEIDGTGVLSGTTGCFGAYVTGNSSSIKNCHIHHINTDAHGSSSGIGTDGFYSGQSIKIDSCWIHDIGPGSENTIHGAYVQNTGGTCTNCLIYKCSGCGIITFHDGSQCNISNNIVFNNDSGGISISGGSNYHLVGDCTNCSVFNNVIYDCTTASNGKGLDEFGTVSGNFYDHNIIVGNSTNQVIINGTVTNTISREPTFVNYIRTGGGDYHSLLGSPQVNSGVSTFNSVAAPSFDIDGVARPKGASGLFDVGAYELNYSAAIIPVGGGSM